MFKSSVFAAMLLSFVSMPVAAQDIATRLLNMENRIRDLTGQMEELNYSMQQLQKQLAGGQQQGAVELAPPKLKKLATAEPVQQGVETIEDAPAVVAAAPVKKQAIILGDEPIETEELAPGPTNLGSGQDNSAGGTTPDVAVAAAPSQGATIEGGQDGIENVSLTPAVDTPEALYEKHYETLLRRQFGEAEAGFLDFLQKYPDHSLAGSAQYQLGETFYAQAKYQEAARNFLQGYKNYPKSRRAPDSLLKLGLSLRKLDQRDQACAALASVSTEFPRAVEAKKRAQAELKRAGC
jgi:tol-pal system protein YbgF